MEVLAVETGEPIPGLFAVGNTAGNFYGGVGLLHVHAGPVPRPCPHAGLCDRQVRRQPVIFFHPPLPALFYERPASFLVKRRLDPPRGASCVLWVRRRAELVFGGCFRLLVMARCGFSATETHLARVHGRIGAAGGGAQRDELIHARLLVGLGAEAAVVAGEQRAEGRRVLVGQLP